jgi:hypothetical protein
MLSSFMFAFFPNLWPAQLIVTENQKLGAKPNAALKELGSPEQVLHAWNPKSPFPKTRGPVFETSLARSPINEIHCRHLDPDLLTGDGWQWCQFSC